MIVAAAVVAAALIAAVVAFFATRAKPVAITTHSAGDDTWTATAGSELAGLSESERCDLIFAVAALGDDASRALLERALDDSSEAVALAAAHALARLGNAECVDRYLVAHAGERASRISAVLDVLISG